MERVANIRFESAPGEQLQTGWGHFGTLAYDGSLSKLYALAVTERLGLEDSGGMVRVGPVHYNTLEEIKQFGEALGRISGNVS